MYLLDTNVISEFRKLDKADKRVAAWAASVPKGSLFLSAITIMEIEMGILQIERRDPKQGALFRFWFNTHVLSVFPDRILWFDTAVARCCAKLHVPDRRSERDAMIAATALVHGMTVVTRNVDDFKLTGVDVLNPWEFRAITLEPSI